MAVTSRQEAVGSTAEKLLDNGGKIESLQASLMNRGSNPAYIGDASVSSTTGFLLGPNDGMDVLLAKDEDEVWAVSPAGTTIHIFQRS